MHGLIVKPATFQAGRKYPTLLRIHGGPNGQDEHAFSFEREFFAANGYVVVAVNYRGSNGRGSAYQKAIFADWGGKEVVDLLGAMDHVQKLAVVDADRLGIGGWSYGGILTDYTIATDGRFKAATSGAGSALQLSMYGVDQYITQYENEIGPPWKAQDLWIKISYPFFHADRIKTPTLFLGGEKDFNVPLVGGEQMYQALKSLGVDTQLVIYPGQFHGITTPTYKIDRLQRYLDWYDKYSEGRRNDHDSAVGDNCRRRYALRFVHSRRCTSSAILSQSLGRPWSSRRRGVLVALLRASVGGPLDRAFCSSSAAAFMLIHLAYIILRIWNAHLPSSSRTPSRHATPAGSSSASRRRIHHSCHAARPPVPEGGGGLLRRPPRAPVLRQPDQVHVVRALRRDGARGAGRHQEVAHPDGGDRPGQGRRRTPCARTSARRSRTTPRTAPTRPDTAAYELGYFFPGMELA